MSKFSIEHITRYLYEVPVRDSANQIMLYPIKDDFQEVLEHKITITGDPVVDVHTDYFGNEVGIFTHSQPHQELMIDSQLVVVTRAKKIKEDIIPPDQQWEELKKLRTQIPFIDFFRMEPFEALSEVEKIVANEGGKKLTPLKTAKNFCDYVFTNFTYKSGITTVETKLDEIWKLKSGVCQDFAHFLLAILRLEGIPGRYVSGYICPNKNGMRGEGATHAWVEIYIPNQGWIGLDPTNNCFVEENHVKLAVGKDFSDVSPVKGTYRGMSRHTLDVKVTVEYEDGHTAGGKNYNVPSANVNMPSVNSFRRFQEIQNQQ